ncbi:TKL protein kinase [Saprolegnia diclina VS20]|uniref:TKL protein kinase n=1 Tax=Saprolegnia diclina (strain VS20) TaxID=1156394 RepID=T0RE24_SAPDV|nr:TKL protein kinase [Saprolegnia diclina VS20]EQC30513.1 TKL protein kinase [Saprolegnia diclina VS20]|eukprot:XP_008616106.1 TKL protein kinase [Saprolegnia diclina VS20]
MTTDKERELLRAARAGDVAAVASLLDDGVDANCSDGVYTPLRFAACFDQMDVIRLLIDRGANMEACTAKGESLLLCAAQSNQLELVAFLLEKNANLDATDAVGNTALMAAEENGRLQVAQLLRDHKRQRDETYALCTALRAKHWNVVNNLLQRGVHDINLCDTDGTPLLHLVVETQNISLLERLLQVPGLDFNAVDATGRTAVAAAITTHNTEAVTLLLMQTIARVDLLSDCPLRTLAQTYVFGAALRHAAARGHSDTVSYVLRLGVSPTTATEDGETPLHIAAAHGQDGIVAQLLDENVLLAMRRDQKGNVPLHVAAAHGHTTIVTRLLDVAADATNAVNHAGATPLLLAATGGHADAVAALLTAETATSCRILGGTGLLHASARSGSERVVALVLPHCRVLDATDEKGRTPLHLAAASGHAAVAQCLLKNGADPTVRTEEEKATVLMVAAAEDHAAVVDALLAHLVRSISDPQSHNDLKRACERLKSSLAHLDARNSSGKSAAELSSGAVLQRLSDCAASLASDLAHVRKAMQTKETALAQAVATSEWAVAAALLQEGVALVLPADKTENAMRAALESQDKELIQALVQADKSALLQSLKQTPAQLQHEMALMTLVAAVTCDNVPLVIELLRTALSRPLNLVSSSGPSPLHVAAKRASLGMLYVLLTKDLANINAANEEGFTALAIAVREGRSDVAALLLNVGADVSTPLPDHTPLLHLAITTGSSLHLLELLLSALRIDLNQTDKDGYTALAKAVVVGHEAATTRLIENGANVWTLLPTGQTLLAAAIQHHQHAIATELYARMYPGPAEASMVDVDMGDRIARQGGVDVYKATYAGKTVVLKGPRFPNKHVVGALHCEAQEMQGCTSPYVQPLIGILDNGSFSPLVTLPNGDALYSPTMVIEYMDGGDLHETLEKTRFGRDVLVPVSTVDVALVLAYALRDLHRLGKVHRDVKSLNIFLSTEYYIRLGDLGSARTLDGDCMTSNVGTKLWIAPEVVRVGLGGNGREYGPPADIYSFGVVLTELDTRETPYADVDDKSSIPDQVRDGKLRPKMSNDCAPWLRTLADQCLAHDPADRPTADNIIATLLAHRQEATKATSPP